jgi:hypothetical protein
MNKIAIFVFYSILAVLGLFISHFFSHALSMEHGYGLGILASLVLWFSIGCGDGIFNKMSKNKKNFAAGFAAILAVIGGAIWFIGEVLEYTDTEVHPLALPVGAGAALISGVISLILHSSI